MTERSSSLAVFGIKCHPSQTSWKLCAPTHLQCQVKGKRDSEIPQRKIFWPSCKNQLDIISFKTFIITSNLNLTGNITLVSCCPYILFLLVFHCFCLVSIKTSPHFLFLFLKWSVCVSVFHFYQIAHHIHNKVSLLFEMSDITFVTGEWKLHKMFSITQTGTSRIMVLYSLNANLSLVIFTLLLSYAQDWNVNMTRLLWIWR